MSKLPAAILTTSRLAPLHLTPDLLAKCISRGRIAAIEVYADTMLENPQLLWKCPMSLREFACLPADIPILMAIKDSAYLDRDLQNGNEYVSVENVGGVMRLSVTDYWRMGAQWRVDFQISPLDHHKIPSTLKRIKKSIDRTIKYHSADGWLNVPGGDNLTLRLEAIDRLREKCPEAKVFCFSGMESIRWPEWSEAVSQLMEHLKSQTVYFRGIFSIREIKTLLQKGVSLFDTSLVDLMTAESKAILDEQVICLADEQYFADLTPLDPTCACLVCQQGVTKSYLHHLVKTEEMLASVYLQAHNLHQFLSLFPK